jgi:hypothetical protein
MASRFPYHGQSRQSHNADSLNTPGVMKEGKETVLMKGWKAYRVNWNVAGDCWRLVLNLVISRVWGSAELVRPPQRLVCSLHPSAHISKSLFRSNPTNVTTFVKLSLILPARNLVRSHRFCSLQPSVWTLLRFALPDLFTTLSQAG